ncbi:MAG: TolC family protein, partial [Deltaproteobacteria bacterium]|nr:TolC family protein [Deltaproteobacteria bacterium]
MVVAEVAQYYFQLRNAQEQLSIARANERNQLSTVDYVGARRDAGRATELDYSRVRALLEGTRATIPPLERAVRSATYRISVLLGELPTTLTNELLSVQPLPAYTGPVRLGDPKDLLRRRPDLRAAERELASAVASVGVATGDLYPKITFEGSLGVEAASPSDWTSGTASTYRLGPRLSWGIFEYGRTISRVRVADARSDQALSRYEHAVLRALEETENALLSFSSERERRGRLKLAVEASAKALSLIQEQYELGGTDLSTVLEVQRTALQNESQLSQSNLDLNVALVSVYKALGGGWEGYAIDGSELAPTPPVAPSENQG